MEIIEEFDYRNAKGILSALRPNIKEEIYAILSDKNNLLNLKLGENETERQLSSPIQAWFKAKGWTIEKPVFTMNDLRYDLEKDTIPIEIELGHERLVYADFFKFMSDYSKDRIPLGIMIVAGTSQLFGHTWHNSVSKTKKKILAIKENFLVPIWVIGIKP